MLRMAGLHEDQASPDAILSGNSPCSSQKSKAVPTSQDLTVFSGEPSRIKPKPVVKRKRRAPSPSHWIPHSLLAFDLCSSEGNKVTPVPLPPVMPVKYFGFVEERNSWDTSFGRRPYHPEGWQGRLPGPGLGNGFVGRDLGNFGGLVMGRMITS